MIARRPASRAASSPARRLTSLGGGGGATPTAAVRFGVLTPAGEGEQDIAAADGTYSVGGGEFSVSSGRINVVTMPSAGTYDIDGVSVAVVAGARTVSTAAELVARWTASTSGAHPAGTRILIAPGTYELFSLISGTSRLLNNWIYEAVDSDNRPTITTTSDGTLSYYCDTGSAGFTFKQINFYREQDPVGIPWNIVSYDIFQVRNDVTGVTFDDCRFYGNFTPAAQLGKITTKLVGLDIEGGSEATIINCEFDHLCTGVRFEGEIDCRDNILHDIYSDFFEGRAGINGLIKNNHCYNKIGDGTFLHGDWFQLQVPPNTPASGPLIYEGNTHTPGPFWLTAAGQADANKDAPEIAVAGPTVLNDIALYHGARTIRCLVADAGGTMTITLPKASDYPNLTLVPYQVGAGTVTITKDAGDTVEDALTMTSNNSAVSFVSDGVSHWRKVRPGYRGYCQQRNADLTAGDYEKDLSIFMDASGGNRTVTLPSGTGAYFLNVKKDDVSANTVSIALPGGQTFTDHGVTGITTARTLGRCGEVMEFVRLEGETVWTVTEQTTTSQGFFSNGPDDGYDNLIIRNNIFFVNSPNGQRAAGSASLGLGIFRNSKCHNNTFLRVCPPDSNGDGVIGPSDSWNDGAVGNINNYDGMDSFRNAFTGNEVDINVEIGADIRKYQNQAFGWDDPTDLSALNVYLQASEPADLRPVTRAEVVTAALAKVGGPLVIDAPSYSYIGAVGTTSSNGPYNWDTGEANTNTKLPVVASTIPEVGSTGQYINTTIAITFDELITLGTGDITIREVGGDVIETFDVASSGALAIQGNGRTLVILPTSNLPISTNVCVRIEATAIDGYFNSFAGITDDSLEFTTGLTALDPELLPDPGFDDTSKWTKGTGWTVASSLASKAGGTSNFSSLQTATTIAATAGLQYQGIATVGTITTAAGNLRVQIRFLDSGGGTLQTDNTNTALSALSPGGTASHTSTAPAGTASVVLFLVATDGTAVFTLSDASLQAV